MAWLLTDRHILLIGQVSEDMLCLELGFEHLNVIACKMELEFISIWFQLNRFGSENEVLVLVVTDSLIRTKDFFVLVNNNGA